MSVNQCIYVYSIYYTYSLTKITDSSRLTDVLHPWQRQIPRKDTFKEAQKEKTKSHKEHTTNQSKGRVVRRKMLVGWEGFIEMRSRTSSLDHGVIVAWSPRSPSISRSISRAMSLSSFVHALMSRQALVCTLFASVSAIPFCN